jgi:transcription antitermination factor NusG
MVAGQSPGTAVQVVAGAFAGLEGIAGLSSGDRVRVLLAVLGREVQTSVPRADVMVAG